MNITVDEGDTLTLGPTSSHFKEVITTYRPKSIVEVQKLIGVHVPESDRQKNALSTVHCCTPELSSSFVSASDIDVDDPAARARARSVAYAAAREIIHGRFDGVTHWHGLADAFIASMNTIINVARVGEIEVQNRGTLVIAANVQAVYATEIRLYGNGRIVCRGHTTIRAASMRGRLLKIPLSAVVNTNIDRLG